MSVRVACFGRKMRLSVANDILFFPCALGGVPTAALAVQGWDLTALPTLIWQ